MSHSSKDSLEIGQENTFLTPGVTLITTKLIWGYTLTITWVLRDRMTFSEMLGVREVPMNHGRIDIKIRILSTKIIFVKASSIMNKIIMTKTSTTKI